MITEGLTYAQAIQEEPGKTPMFLFRVPKHYTALTGHDRTILDLLWKDHHNPRFLTAMNTLAGHLQALRYNDDPDTIWILKNPLNKIEEDYTEAPTEHLEKIESGNPDVDDVIRLLEKEPIYIFGYYGKGDRKIFITTTKAHGRA